MNGKTLTLSLAVITLLGAFAFAQDSEMGDPDKWHSFPFGATHRKLAKEALKRIDKNQYPDIARFASALKDACASESGHADARRDNGGQPKHLWEKGDKKNPGGVLGNYRAFDIETAYFNIGNICHLTQDQGVPAHAANIAHYTSEGFEAYAAYDFKPGPAPEIDPSKLPYEYYQDLQDDTRSRLPAWVNPDTGLPFWQAPADSVRFGEDATFGPRGSYGGGSDTYSYWVDNSQGGEGNSNSRTMVAKIPEICSERLGASIGYTSAVLRSASRRLPPLVKDLKVSPNLIAPGGKVEIIFTALENRSRNLKYSVTVARGGTEETILLGTMELNDPKPAGYDNNNSIGSNNNQQPAVPENYLFNFTGKIKWNSRFEGKPLEAGAYTLEVSLTDEDGNTVPVDVNTDAIRENDSRAVLTVVNTLPKEQPVQPSFGRK